MAFRLTPWLAPRVLPGLSPGLPGLSPGLPASLPAALARSYSGACAPDPPAPLCPCPPQCPPPCRCRPPDRLRARRVVCCPPPQGQKPPCTPRPPACSLTCASVAAAHTVPSPQDDIPPPPPPGASDCDKHRDMVAQRLVAARAERHRQYAADAARCEAPLPAPRPTLTLAAMRDCQSATDGCTYRLKYEPGNTTAPLSCGPCRTAPPEACLELMPDNACMPKKRPGIDPCAHKPRVLLHIDRSGCGTKPPAGSGHSSAHVTASQHKSSSTSDSNTCPCPPLKKSATVARQKCKDNSKPSSSEGLTSRIMKTLSLGRSSGGAVAGPKCGEEDPQPSPGKARYAGDQSWCATASAPRPAAPRCRPSSLAERLGRRPPAACTKRKLHMLAAVAACGPEPKPSSPKDMASFAEKIKADNVKLEQVLKERSQLKDAALGRSVVCEKKKKCTPKPPVHGCFDVQVPPTSSPLRLRVFYDEICIPVPPRCSTKDPPKQAPSSKSFSSSSQKMKTVQSSTTTTCNKTAKTASAVKSQKSDSWLSMKSLKQTIAGCVKTESKSGCDKKPPAAKKPSCGPAAVVSKADKGDDKNVIKPVCPAPGPSPRCHPGLKTQCPPAPEPPKRDPCDPRPRCDPLKGDPKSKDSKDNKKKC